MVQEKRIFIYPERSLTDLKRKHPNLNPWRSLDEVLGETITRTIEHLNTATRIYAPSDEVIVPYDITHKAGIHLTAHPIGQRVPITRIEAENEDTRITSVEMRRGRTTMGLLIKTYSKIPCENPPDIHLGFTIYHNPKRS